jgi:uncharacterized membrane protein
MTALPEAAIRPGLSPHRVVMFADAILAIAITLLAIELPRPEGEQLHSAAAFGHFLHEEQGSFFAFVLAFLMLWWVWRTHHLLFDNVSRMSQLTLALHIPLLLGAVWMPYPTEIFGHAASNGLAVFLFAATEGIMMICLGLLSATVIRQRLYPEGADTARMRTGTMVNVAIGLYWVITGTVAFFASFAPLLWMGTPVVAFTAARLSRSANGHST